MKTKTQKLAAKLASPRVGDYEDLSLGKSVAVKAYFWAYKGVPQTGLWAVNPEDLNVVLEFFSESKRNMEAHPDKWGVIEAVVVYQRGVKQ